MAGEINTSEHTKMPWLRLAFGVIVLLAVIVVATRLGQGREFWQRLRAVKPLPLSVALLLQAGTYVCVASILKQALASEGESRSLHNLLPLALAKQFVSQALPSLGVSGNLMLIRGLENRKISRPMAVRTVLLSLLSYYFAFALMLAAATAILWILRDLTPVILFVLSTLMAVFASLILTCLWLGGGTFQMMSPRVSNWLIEHELSEYLKAGEELPWNIRLFSRAALLQVAIFAFDSTTFFVLLAATGTSMPPTVVFASLVTANAAASIGLVPGGLGTFEGTSVALLHAHGADVEAALAGTLLLRGFTFWLPMLPGLVISRREIARQT